MSARSNLASLAPAGDKVASKFAISPKLPTSNKHHDSQYKSSLAWCGRVLNGGGWKCQRNFVYPKRLLELVSASRKRLALSYRLKKYFVV